jgi:hypothetical protein
MTQKLASLRSEPVSTRLPTKLTSLRSEPVTVNITSGTKFFRVFRGYEGKQIVLNWGLSVSGLLEMKIVRRLDAWPENTEDGVLIVHDVFPWTMDKWSDRNSLEPYRVYYYALYMLRQDGVWLQDRKLRGKTFPLPTGYFADKLWNSLPNVYHRVDGEN